MLKLLWIDRHLPHTFASCREDRVRHRRNDQRSPGLAHSAWRLRTLDDVVPVSPSTSRSTHSNGVSPSTSTERFVPFMLSKKAICHSVWDLGQRLQVWLETRE